MKSLILYSIHTVYIKEIFLTTVVSDKSAVLTVVSLATPMLPIVQPKRVEITGGLWTPKIGGNFEEGDPKKTKFYISGNAEIKGLSGQLKLFIKGVDIIMRKNIDLGPVVVQGETHEPPLADNDGDKHGTAHSQGGTASNTAANTRANTPEKKERNESEEVPSEEKVEVVEIKVPKLYAYLSKKKPKVRMPNIHKEGAKLYLPSKDSVFGTKGSIGDFEVYGVIDFSYISTQFHISHI